MTTYRVYDIRYDSDGKTIKAPNEILVTLPDDADPAEDLADAVSDKTGWCVFGVNYEKIPTMTSDLHTVRVTLAPGAEAHIVWIACTVDGWAFGASALGQESFDWHPSRHETRLAAHAAAVAALRAAVPPVKVLVRSDDCGGHVTGEARFTDGMQCGFLVYPSGSVHFQSHRGQGRAFRSTRRAIDLRAALALAPSNLILGD